MNTPASHYETLRMDEARAIQNELRSQLRSEPLKKAPLTIAGADISLNMFSDVVYAGIIILRYSDLQPIAYSLVKGRTKFPYVPGFLAFREVPALMEAYEQIPVTFKPDVVMVDGHGVAHPRRMGIAAHFGVLAGVPAMGCAKKMLFGKWLEPAPEQGAYTSIMDQDEILGYALRTKNKVKPVFISPGHNMTLPDCLSIANHCTGRYRLPEPTRRAHEYVNLFRTGVLQAGYYTIDARQTSLFL